MPVMDGVTFLTALREEEEARGDRSIPVILMTGGSDDRLKNAPQIDRVLFKPCFLEKLKKVLGELL